MENLNNIIGEKGTITLQQRGYQASQQTRRTKFIDLRSDFGFRKLFFEDPNKDMLIAFLNALFKDRKVISDLSYNKTEHPGDNLSEGNAIFDLICTGDDGSRFLIEMQRATQQSFIKRSIFYTSRLISGMAPVGDRAKWDYNINEVYFIGLIDGFALNGTPELEYLHDICLCHRDSGEVFYEGLGYLYIELLKFEKTENELESILDKWLYVLKNMSTFNEIPTFLRKTIFEKVFKIASYSNLTKDEKMEYDLNLKKEWDTYSALTTAEAKGKEVGKLETQEHLIKNLILEFNFSDEQAAKAAEVSVDFVKKVREFLKK